LTRKRAAARARKELDPRRSIGDTTRRVALAEPAGRTWEVDFGAAGERVTKLYANIEKVQR
jgi:hypothetical protein